MKSNLLPPRAIILVSDIGIDRRSQLLTIGSGMAAQLSTANLISDLTEIEETAEKILTDKQQIVDLDKKRQQTREAIRVLNKDKVNNKCWVCIGNMFLKLPKKSTKNLLENDFNQLDREINSIRNDLKPKMNKLRDLENKDDLKGFNLEPLTKDEIRAIENLL
ncbi:p53 and DNA damage-regulated protein 1 [Acanthosepion pharaonis]|uniref:p53 and DNA damage-regulated protein 1 n=1 Tax=Acanthosepion pharaonis TaxID=158019 RepID=A0A812E7E8_ACAPH|nr:p53 and DNA damage-regulated protein 1 [Sepia pharaonis]